MYAYIISLQQAICTYVNIILELKQISISSGYPFKINYPDLESESLRLAISYVYVR